MKRGGGLGGLRCDSNAFGDPAGHAGGRCTTVHPEKEVLKDDGPHKGPVLNEVNELSRG